MNYQTFLDKKSQLGGNHGFEPLWMPDSLFGFQSYLDTWAIQKGRAALFSDCGTGKTFMELVFGENVVRKTNKPVLLLTPLAVGAQTVGESEKFGVQAERSSDGRFSKGAKIIITNYERLHYFNPDEFAGTICDESSILKNFDGATKTAITEFMRKQKYRLLATATAAPNDFIELGTSSEAIGELGFMDMISKFFKKVGQTSTRSDELRFGTWRFRGHAEQRFWRWVCSWARACRKPSDLGFEDDGFVLPMLSIREHVVHARTKNPDFLFDLPAFSLHEQRDERRRTIKERCEMAAELIAQHKQPAVAWCHLNDEGDLLEELIPDCVQVSGSDSTVAKEEKLEAFARGKVRVMVSKPEVAGLGLNWQHCAHQTFFPSHSFEQWYQAIRRSWRFGQKKEVIVDVITSEGEARVLVNLKRKAEAAERMFSNLVHLMNNELHITQPNSFQQQEHIPSWLA